MPVSAIGELQRLLSAERIGRAVRIALVRNGQRVETQAVPSELDDDERAPGE